MKQPPAVVFKCFIPIDFNHDSICGLTKFEWAAGVNVWDWVTCPICLAYRAHFEQVKESNATEN